MDVGILFPPLVLVKDDCCITVIRLHVESWHLRFRVVDLEKVGGRVGLFVSACGTVVVAWR